jgi:serine O-acetyltransferase
MGRSAHGITRLDSLGARLNDARRQVSWPLNGLEESLRMGALRNDVTRAYEHLDGGRFKRLAGCLRSPGVQAIAVFRFGHWLRRQPGILRLFLEPFYMLLNGLIQIMWGIEMSRAADIGPGLYIGHFGGITIAPGAIIGKRCNLSNNITIGVSGQGERMGCPRIGDDVYIAPGARLFGKIVVGNNVKIGANAVIHADIPDNAIAVMDPGFKIISLRGNRSTVLGRVGDLNEAEAGDAELGFQRPLL